MPTPNIDRMANEGVTLLSVYAQPSCTPGRAAMQTGRFPNRTDLRVELCELAYALRRVIAAGLPGAGELPEAALASREADEERARGFP